MDERQALPDAARPYRRPGTRLHDIRGNELGCASVLFNCKLGPRGRVRKLLGTGVMDVLPQRVQWMPGDRSAIL